jgi:dihydroxyacetone kinase
MKIRILFTALLGLVAQLAGAQMANPAQAGKVAWDSIVCGGVPFVCNKLAAQGYLFAGPDQKKVVMISHGSQGIDSRMFDYVDSLQKEGFAALVIDH